MIDLKSLAEQADKVADERARQKKLIEDQQERFKIERENARLEQIESIIKTHLMKVIELLFAVLSENAHQGYRQGSFKYSIASEDTSIKNLLRARLPERIQKKVHEIEREEDHSITVYTSFLLDDDCEVDGIWIEYEF